MGQELGSVWLAIGAKMDSFDKSMSDVEKAMKKVGARLEKVGKDLTKKLTLPLVALGGASVKAFSDFDKSMTESLAIMDGVSDAMRTKMEDAAKQMSTETTFAANELAQSYFYLASAGMDAAQSIEALPVVAKFAQAGAFDLKVATDLLTDAQTALGLSSKDATKNQENLIKVSDVLVKANTLANASVQQFSEALTNRAAAALVNVNKGMEEGVAVLAAFADKGVKGQLAGTRLAMMLNALDVAARNNKEAWDRFGIKLFDARGEMRHTGDIIGDLENLFRGLTTEQKAATLAQLGFNVRTKASILTLMGSSEKIKQWTKNLHKAGDTTEEVSKKQLQTFANQLKLLRNRLVIVGIELGSQLIPALLKIVEAMKPVLEKITDAIKKFGDLSQPMKTIILSVIAFVAAAGPMLVIVGKLTQVLANLRVIGIAKLIPAMGALTASILAGYGAYKLLIKAREKWEKSHGKYTEEETKRWAELNRQLGGWTSFAGKAAALLAKNNEDYEEHFKRLNKLWKEYHGQSSKLLKDIASGMQGPELKKVLEDVAGGHLKAAEAADEQKDILGEVTEEADKLVTAIKSKLNKALKDNTKEVKEATKKTDEFVRVIDEWVVEQSQVPPIVEQTGNSLNHILGPVLSKVANTANTASDDLYGLKYNMKGVADESEDSGEKISFNWDRVSEDISRYWLESFANMGDTLKNFSDFVIQTINTLAVGIGSALSEFLGDKLKGSLGKLSGPIASVIGGLATSAISMLANLFKGKSREERLAESMAKSVKGLQKALKHLGDISEDTAKKFLELKKRYGEIAAGAMTLSEWMKDTGINTQNFTEYAHRLNSILDDMDKGLIRTAQGLEAADSAFEVLIEGAKELGKEGSKEIVKFILHARKMGYELKSVSEYSQEQLSRVPKALHSLIEAHVTNARTAKEMGLVAIQSFNAMLESGMSWMDAVEQMKNPLAALKEKYEELGLTSDESLQRLFDIARVTEHHEDLFTKIQANKEIIEALGNSGWLTSDILQSLAQDARQFYNQLITAGVDSEDALRAIAPTLQQIYDYAKAYGFEVDANTQKLIDQAKEIGLVKDAEADRIKEQERLFDRLADRISESMERLADRIENLFKTAFSDAFDDAADQAHRLVKDINKTFEGVNIPGDKGHGNFGIPRFQEGGAFTVNRPTPIIVDPNEFINITPFKDMPRGGGGSNVFEFHINTLDASDFEQVVSEKIIPSLKTAIEGNVDGITKTIADESGAY